MGESRVLRQLVTAVVLVLGVSWALASARQPAEASYPGGRFLATAAWLTVHLRDPGVRVVDVRADKDFDGRVIPGAVRLPWDRFRYDDPATGVGDAFVGTVRAQELLGAHGLLRTDTVVLYDTVAKDGGAVASYVFWVLDLLGHENVKVLERGLDGWMAAGGAVAAEPRAAEPVLYQAPAGEIRRERGADGAFVASRLGDPHYQVLDVRSREEYLGEKPNQALDGGALKLGHVPTAVNVDYGLNWVDRESKALKSYPELLALYRGLDPAKTVVTYCHSGRRGSFTYFVLRLMGFTDVRLYEASWYEWGNPRYFFPVELEERKLTGAALPAAVRKAAVAVPADRPAPGAAPAAGGYVSCGG